MCRRSGLLSSLSRTSAAAALSVTLSLLSSACAERAITDPGPSVSSKCPVASVASEPGTLTPRGTPSLLIAEGGGCDHRARVDLPLDRVIDLNDNAEVLGTETIGGQSQLVVWSKSGERVLTAPVGSLSVDAYDLNNNGQAVGCSYADSFGTLSGRRETVPLHCQLVLWDAQGRPTLLGTLGVAGAVEARPAAINDAGVIVGDIVRADGSHQAFVRSAAGVVTLISTPGTQSGAVAINESGTVAGWYSSGSAGAGVQRAFTWTASAGITDLGTLPGGGSGTESSLMPVAIDAAGDVVGDVYSYTTATGSQIQTSTFLYTTARGIRDLETLSGIDDVVDVNAQGEILGWATLDGSHQPVTWSETRGSLLAVRYGPSYSASPSSGELHNINSWNEVLDTFSEASVLKNVIWTWDPERYR